MESFSKISSMLGQARDLTVEAATAAVANSGRTYGTRLNTTSAVNTSSKELKKLLNSRYDRDILDGLRRVVTMMCRGHDCSEYFADVVKNVASPTLEIKKLVYTYLLQYAESEPDLALLSINTIQKALNDQNQVVRAMAIRVMSGIRVPVISQIVALGIKRCVGDLSPYVRKAGALAIPKCYRLDPSTLPQLSDYIATLLGDKSYYVVGAAVMAFWEVCPERLDMIHPHYRALCKLLIDMDEWGQLALLKLLTIYARKHFPAHKSTIQQVKAKEGTDEFYSDIDSGNKVVSTTSGERIDSDLELLLRSCPPLLQSRNSAVIIAVAKTYFHLAPASYLTSLPAPLLSLLRAPSDIQYVALSNIVHIALEYPSIFAPYCTHFLFSSNDPPYIWKLKIEALTLTYPYATKHHQNLILAELSHLAAGYDKELIKEAVRGIGRCAQNTPQTSIRCLNLLMKLLESSDGMVVAESLTVIRHIIQQNPQMHKKTVIRLAKSLDTAESAAARASIIWLVGEFASVDDNDSIAPDVLRILAKSFTEEAEQAKLQIVLLAAKVYAHYLNKQAAPPATLENAELSDEEDEDMHPIPQLFKYIARLARYDVSYDLRDRTRLYLSLLSSRVTVQLATLVLLAPKPVPFAPSPSAALSDGLTLGSSALLIGKDHLMRGYEDLPDWVDEKDALPSYVRDPTKPANGEEYTREAKSVAPATTSKPIERQSAQRQTLEPVKGKEIQEEKTLDQWLESDEEQEDLQDNQDNLEETSSEEEDSSDEEEEEDGDEDDEDESEEDDSEEAESDEDAEESDEDSQQESSKMLRK